MKPFYLILVYNYFKFKGCVIYMSKISSIKEINNYLSSLIDNDYNLTNINLKGEISNLKKHGSGHYYLTLKDNESSIKAIIFK